MKPWPHRFAVLLACAVWGLIFLGGLVTTTHSGLAVPDWPLSYGRLMPPMKGGILFEHGHRMAAAAVGLLTILTALVFARWEPRPWVRRAAWAAVGLVVLQGVFGGLTVLLKLPPAVSILHACLAQTFFCLAVALAFWTSPAARAPVPPRAEPPGPVPLDRMALLLFAALALQLVLGAVVRHTGRGVFIHAANAGVVLLLLGGVFQRLLLHPGQEKTLWALAQAVLWTLFLQIALGAGAYVVLSGPTKVPPPARTLLVTVHVAAGALILGLSLLLLLEARRARPAAGHSFRRRLADYLTLTKPGISLMSAVTALTAFLLGSAAPPDLRRLLQTVIGTLLVAAGAGALNMVLEIDVDGRMRRTEHRPLPARRLRPGEALFFGTFLAAAGILYLAWAVNFLTAFLAALTLSVYIYLYTPLKKVTALCTAVGAVAGALPPVMGWAAARGRLGPEAWTLFAILFFWQFPHFLALAWMYKDDYARAGLSMLPVIEPDGESTARKMALNSFALWGVSLLPGLLGMTGSFYFWTALSLGAGLTLLSLTFFWERSRQRARQVFLASVLYIPFLAAVMVLNRVPAAF